MSITKFLNVWSLLAIIILAMAFAAAFADVTPPVVSISALKENPKAYLETRIAVEGTATLIKQKTGTITCQLATLIYDRPSEIVRYSLRSESGVITVFEVVSDCFSNPLPAQMKPDIPIKVTGIWTKFDAEDGYYLRVLRVDVLTH